MLGPGWEQGCPSCSLLADHFDPSVIHLAQRDVTLLAVSRAPLARSKCTRSAMGWHFKWYRQMGTTSTSTISVVHEGRDGEGQSWTTTTKCRNSGARSARRQRVLQGRGRRHLPYLFNLARGLDILIGAYNFLDLRAEGPRRERPELRDGVGPASRPVLDKQGPGMSISRSPVRRSYGAPDLKGNVPTGTLEMTRSGNITRIQTGIHDPSRTTH